MLELLSGPLGPTWIWPRDYRDVTHFTPFDPEKRRQIKIYRRQPEREQLVEEKIRKQRVLELSRPDAHRSTCAGATA